ncbi:hypothetical protein [Aliivibrio fischeri]|uniref:hypothetical protein n=1 Tax=Aliivibrio fischeri TaxID=668 RepID=UPI00080E1128|nr:hypothetical protein [Aliivibrio fischeri]OCH05716.1 hypothetical protein A6E11_01725 [Aliivibrio fischeri]
MYHFFFYIYSALMPIKLGFFFGGASRYIPLRVTILFFLFSLVWSFVNNKNILSYKLIVSSIIYFSLSLTFILVWSFHVDDFNGLLSKYILGFIFPYLIFINIYIATKFLNVCEIDRTIKIYIISGLFLITIDTMIRLIHPEFAFKGDPDEFSAELLRDSFYIFKYGSIMYLDSNYVALHLLVILSLIYNVFFGRLKFFLIIITVSLILLSFSRSAYLGVLLFFLVLFFKNQKMLGKWFLVILFSLFSLFLVFYFSYNNFNSSDVSLNSKFEIFDSLSKVDIYNIYIVLFGIGFEVGGYLYSFREGAYAHALVTLLLGEVGIFGLIMYIGFILYALNKYFNELVTIVPVMLLCGMSLIYPWDSIYIYSISILIYKKNLSMKINNV